MNFSQSLQFGSLILVVYLSFGLLGRDQGLSGVARILVLAPLSRPEVFQLLSSRRLQVLRQMRGESRFMER